MKLEVKSSLDLQPYHMITNLEAKQDEAWLIFGWENHLGQEETNISHLLRYLSG